ncbi:TetR/AcrR family transcriptional regulator [Nocardia sp. AG03]|uniref:TetR/AcrR family transcriptional regulator n=1 Tax=Nocardia sp. AG03 TaxID=3025312 RepID=UPI0024186086|nr:TetR/AcrR family transcriptional regulator [Nocardia sp. AG03]
MAVTATGTSDTHRRRRRTPEAARQEILTAASDLLTRIPIAELTVATLMAHTTLSRKSFYVYFNDRVELLEALVRPLRAEADATLEQWAAAEDPVGAGLVALAAAARTYHRHGEVLRAILYSSSTDPELRRLRAGLVDPVIAVATGIVERTAPDLPDPGRTAMALITMNIHVLLNLDAAATEFELTAAVETLAMIWRRTLMVA